MANGAVTLHTDSRAYLLKNNVESIGQDDFYQVGIIRAEYVYRVKFLFWPEV